MSFGKNLRFFIDKNFDSHNEFARLLCVDKAVVSRYISEKNFPNKEVLQHMIKLGLSLDWALTGYGCMCIDPEVCLEKSLKASISPFQRIEEWIVQHYNTLENYVALLNCDIELIRSYLRDEIVPNQEFLRELRKSGCNINWIATGQGSPYADNQTGTILQLGIASMNRKDTNINVFDSSIKLSENFRDYASKAYWELLKSAIVKEQNDEK